MSTNYETENDYVDDNDNAAPIDNKVLYKRKLFNETSKKMKKMKLNVNEESTNDYNLEDTSTTKCDGEDAKVNDDCIVSPVKHVKNKKRQSSSSVASTASNENEKRVLKSVVGELIAKNSMSISNETFYLFKFLINNNGKEYYGDANQFYNLKINSVYETTLVVENGKICIGPCVECKNKDSAIVVEHYLSDKNFDSNDTVSLYARLKYGFKIIDNADAYKCVFHILMGDDENSCSVKEIECTSDLKKLCAVIKNCDVGNAHDFLQFVAENKDKVLRLQRVKCNQTNAGLKSFTISHITQIEYDNKVDKTLCDIDEDDIVENVSRVNKIIYENYLQEVSSEFVAGNNNNDRLNMQLQMQNSTDKIKAVLFTNSYGNVKNKNNKNLQRIDVDVNQLTDLIQMNIITAQMHLVHDVDKNNYTVLGVTKYDVNNELYTGM
ncbi:late expression factor 3 [Ectropis obliqua nucleopolyhedrovirus]|uniref:Late expression factor 3 n=1 Tax=Ectropis obliqua nucleopolyhedrovirus TaxID=59376 RepID=A0EYV9_9ABAC|nr:late expression factor 3 [Ectropis obliqua nucleopolyhedrovirus]ABI35739.1 late expression factor 3 [Ectropis obliqua nucleopolyhedrovirus]AGS47911.1 late expression factor 3 [Ectropis obliqua nucleopolyhedrovirus]QWV59675.1 late expression factor 3 [Ectropis obliqua nucleopolyhedrovirus]UYO72854.1 late expression factor 3 [Ectropis obliqua nucleopolyhedrovirus]